MHSSYIAIQMGHAQLHTYTLAPFTGRALCVVVVAASVCDQLIASVCDMGFIVGDIGATA